MLKEIRVHRKPELIAIARQHRLCDATVEFPAWYMQRWHFLPEGYFSARSVRLYERFIRHIYNIGLERFVLERARDEVMRGRPSMVIELGCGPGNALRALAAQPARLVGIDLSPFMLEAARRDNPVVELLHGDARSTSIEKGSVDLVFAMHVFGHVPAAVADEMVAEAARVLRAGGRLIAVDHSWHRVPDLADCFEALGARKMLASLLTMSAWQRIATVRLPERRQS